VEEHVTKQKYGYAATYDSITDVSKPKAVKLVETRNVTSLTDQEASLKTDFAAHNGSEPANPASVGQRENRQAIADRMEALAIELRSLSDDEMQTVPTEGTLFALARKIYSARRKVDEIFGVPGFSVSPAWDILLDLYQAKNMGKEISVTSACIGAACPPTTALRWLQALESLQLVKRQQDHEDKRRSMIKLTEGGKVKVVNALALHL
jgi:hypothetical protein